MPFARQAALSILIAMETKQTMEQKITYTLTDESPALATAALLPIIQAFCEAAGLTIETRDISLAGRILAAFPELLSPQQQVSDALAELGEMVLRPDANIIKLPNISASVPQLRAAISELHQQGFAIPDYPENPDTDTQRDYRARYDRIKGSAVNPVLRQGNSDRRVARAVKEYARMYPHSMGEWTSASRARVASMQQGDYYETETSCAVGETAGVPGPAQIRFVPAQGETQVLRAGIPLKQGEIIDSAVLRRTDLRAYVAEEIRKAKQDGVLFSVHLKATMMKVSDPIIFGHVVDVFFRDVFEKHADTFARLGIHPNNGLGDVYARIAELSQDEQDAIRADIQACFENGPAVSMVDSAKGISNFHVPSDFIIDATMPAAIRLGGKSWGLDGKLADTSFLIPDRSYAGVYQTIIDDCKQNGAFDPKTMGSVSNVGLMAQKAEEYGSHDKTFEMPAAGRVEIVDSAGTVILSQSVEEGDIFRSCRVQDPVIRNWVQLAVRRARETGTPAVFWLDEKRAHDAQLITKVQRYLAQEETDGLDISILSPEAATQHAATRARRGEDSISVTGNVLRDYLTDLFPILELETSAKMLSIVPLMNGGGLFETGAGGSAPKLVQQLQQEGHFAWDSVGEFLALTVSLQHLASVFNNDGAALLADALDAATATLLKNGKSPGFELGQLDNRGSQFYLCMYWSKEIAQRAEDSKMRSRFASLADNLEQNEQQILQELQKGEGSPVDFYGYYHADPARIAEIMRPSVSFNRILQDFCDSQN